MKQKTKSGKYLKQQKTSWSGAVTVAVGAFLAVACILFYAALWYVGTYGDTGFDSILFTLFSDLGGTQLGLMMDFCLEALLPALLTTAVLCTILVVLPRKYAGCPRWLLRTLAIGASTVMLAAAGIATGLPEYLYGMFNQTSLFEKYYVAPGAHNITFPEKKRNLIYIFLESMETTYLSQDLGGAQEENLIPALTGLAQENLCFSHNADVGGFLPVNGTTWTIGAMVAHTSGVPLKTPSDVEDWQNGYGEDGEFLPGILSLQDVLAAEGYYQTLMVGSVASFGGRSVYYETHGADHIYDLSTARRDGIVPSDYFVWWGMEDKYLFEYAKQELTEISQREEPFAFTMLTVDTHHIGGYVCEYCGSSQEEQYENVISCSDRQVAEFVAWLREQPFYADTTIIITGDHLSMDRGYFERNVEEDYVRRDYNCFINAAAETTHSKNRKFSALDMFPTTLAAMGCKIEGEYLGLGVNLFSGKPTLIEKLGYAEFDRQLGMDSDYYAEVFRLEEPDPTGE